jgi:hypothetical protein
LQSLSFFAEKGLSDLLSQQSLSQPQFSGSGFQSEFQFVLPIVDACPGSRNPFLTFEHLLDRLGDLHLLWRSRPTQLNVQVLGIIFSATLHAGFSVDAKRRGFRNSADEFCPAIGDFDIPGAGLSSLVG